MLPNLRTNECSSSSWRQTADQDVAARTRGTGDRGGAGRLAHNLVPSVREVLKRRYKRDYMRRWRRDPRNVAQEAEARKRSYYARKCRRVLSEMLADAHVDAKATCGFCGRRSPVCEIERLVIGADANRSFTPVRVPYCGIC